MPADDVDDETHPLILTDVPIVMPSGDLPVVREGTIAGIPAYEATIIVPLPRLEAVSPSMCCIIDNIGTE